MCKLVRLTSEFYKHKTGKFAGLPISKCKQCTATYKKKYVATHPKPRECIVCKSVALIGGGTTNRKMSQVCSSCSLKNREMTSAKLRTVEILKAIPKKFGSGHYKWKGGITPLHRAIRESAKYHEWRQSIREKDNFTCRLCGKRGGIINVDHYPRQFKSIFAAFMESEVGTAEDYEDFWDINNGRTLCKPCHNKVTWPTVSKEK